MLFGTIGTRDTQAQHLLKVFSEASEAAQFKQTFLDEPYMGHRWFIGLDEPYKGHRADEPYNYGSSRYQTTGTIIRHCNSYWYYYCKLTKHVGVPYTVLYQATSH